MPIQAGGTYALLHLDARDANNYFINSSPINRIFTDYHGSPVISSAQSKFGGASLYLNGSSSIYAGSPTNDWDFRWGDFTIEFWVRFDQLTGTPHVINAGTGTSNRFLLYLNAGFCTFYTNLQGAAANRITSSQPSSVGVWEHWALVRFGNTTTLYKDGVPVGSALGVPMPDLSSNATICIGSNQFGPAAGDFFKGYLDDIRIVYRRAVYTGAFTPPTAQLEVLPGTDVNAGPLPDRKLLARSTVNFNPKPTIQRQPIDLRDRAPFGLPATPVELQGISPAPRPWQFKGRGRIAGTVKEKSTPTDKPVYRRVRLYREPDGKLVRAVWSHPVTGAYEFYGIPLDAKYTVVSHDYQGQYRAVLADNLAPELIP